MTDADTVHWTGKPQPLRCTVRVDGRSFRVMGAQPANATALPQIDMTVWPTRTIYRFADQQVKLELTFLTPALPSSISGRGCGLTGGERRQASDLLRVAQRLLAVLAEQSRAFDEQLIADLKRVGGEQYASLCALAYRQTLAGNKLAADAHGMPLLFPNRVVPQGPEPVRSAGRQPHHDVPDRLGHVEHRRGS